MVNENSLDITDLRAEMETFTLTSPCAVSYDDLMMEESTRRFLALSHHCRYSNSSESKPEQPSEASSLDVDCGVMGYAPISESFGFSAFKEMYLNWVARVRMNRRSKKLPSSILAANREAKICQKFRIDYSDAAYDLSSLSAAGKFPPSSSEHGYEAPRFAERHVFNSRNEGLSFLLPNGNFASLNGIVVDEVEDTLYHVLLAMVNPKRHGVAHVILDQDDISLEDIFDLPYYTLMELERRVMAGLVALYRVYGRDMDRLSNCRWGNAAGKIAQLFRNEVEAQGLEEFLRGSEVNSRVLKMSPIQKLRFLYG